MTTSPAWRKTAALLCAYHNEHGASATTLTPNPVRLEGGFTAVSETLLGVEGRELSEKMVRDWFWAQRNTRPAEATLVWSCYDEDDQKSYVGWGKECQECPPSQKRLPFFLRFSKEAALQPS